MRGHYDLCCGVTSSILADYDELVNATALVREAKLQRLLRRRANGLLMSAGRAPQAMSCLFKIYLNADLQGRISITVPLRTARQISSISSSVTAMQPSVQSLSLCAAPTAQKPFGSPCTNTSPPGETPIWRADARSRVFG
jgi:hypothetical protein